MFYQKSGKNDLCKQYNEFFKQYKTLVQAMNNLDQSITDEIVKISKTLKPVYKITNTVINNKNNSVRFVLELVNKFELDQHIEEWGSYIGTEWYMIKNSVSYSYENGMMYKDGLSGGWILFSDNINDTFSSKPIQISSQEWKDACNLIFSEKLRNKAMMKIAW